MLLELHDGLSAEQLALERQISNEVDRLNLHVSLAGGVYDLLNPKMRAEFVHNKSCRKYYAAVEDWENAFGKVPESLATDDIETIDFAERYLLA